MNTKYPYHLQKCTRGAWKTLHTYSELATPSHMVDALNSGGHTCRVVDGDTGKVVYPK